MGRLKWVTKSVSIFVPGPPKFTNSVKLFQELSISFSCYLLSLTRFGACLIVAVEATTESDKDKHASPYTRIMPLDCSPTNMIVQLLRPDALRLTTTITVPMTSINITINTITIHTSTMIIPSVNVTTTYHLL